MTLQFIKSKRYTTVKKVFNISTANGEVTE